MIIVVVMIIRNVITIGGVIILIVVVIDVVSCGRSRINSKKAVLVVVPVVSVVVEGVGLVVVGLTVVVVVVVVVVPVVVGNRLFEDAVFSDVGMKHCPNNSKTRTLLPNPRTMHEAQSIFPLPTFACSINPWAYKHGIPWPGARMALGVRGRQNMERGRGNHEHEPDGAWNWDKWGWKQDN